MASTSSWETKYELPAVDNLTCMLVIPAAYIRDGRNSSHSLTHSLLSFYHCRTRPTQEKRSRAPVLSSSFCKKAHSNYSVKMTLSSSRIFISNLEKDATRSSTVEHNREIPLIIHHLANGPSVHESVRQIYSSLDPAKARKQVYDFLQHEAKQ
jgi:hypothetical protein